MKNYSFQSTELKIEKKNNPLIIQNLFLYSMAFLGYHPIIGELVLVEKIEKITKNR